jgi:hypothetical protein
VGQHAGLGWNLVVLDDPIEHFQQLADGAQAIAGRVDADHGIAIAIQQSVEHARGDARRIVGGMVGLQTRRQPPAQADRVAKARHHADFLRHQNQVLDAHDLRHGGGHLGC